MSQNPGGYEDHRGYHQGGGGTEANNWTSSSHEHLQHEHYQHQHQHEQQHQQETSYRQTYSHTSAAAPAPVYEEYQVVTTAPAYTVVNTLPVPPPIAVCRFCGAACQPILTYEPAITAYLVCILCCIFIPVIGLILGILVIFSDAFREPRYSCPFCGAYMGPAILY